MKKLYCVLITVLLLFLFAGCSGSASNPSPTKVVTSFLDSLKAGDFSNMSQYMVNAEAFEKVLMIGEDSEIPAFITALLSKLDYTIIEESVNGDMANVKVEITIIDLRPIFSGIIMQTFNLAFPNSSSRDIITMVENIIIEEINSIDALKMTSIVDIELKKDDSGWKIIVADDLINALTGGIGNIADAFAHLTNN